MADDTTSYGLDVEESGFKRLQSWFTELAKGGREIVSVGTALDKKGKDITLRVKGLTEEGQAFTQAFVLASNVMRLTDHSLTSLGKNFEITADGVKHLTDVSGEGAAKISRITELSIRDQQNATVERLNEELKRRDSVLKIQQDLYNKLAQEARVAQGQEIRENAELHARIQEQNRADAGQRIRERAEQHAVELEDARRLKGEILRERAEMHAREQELNQNRAGGTGITGQLRGQFVPRTLSNVTSGEYQAFIAGQARIRSLVESGAISQRQAWEVVQNTLRQTGTVYTGVAAQVQAATAQIDTAQKRLGASHAAELAKAEAASSKTGTRILITWQDVVRFIQFRVAYAIGFHLVGAFKQATQDIREFEIRISEIRTLAQEAGTTFEQWGDIIYKLSNRFGTPVEDIAKGVYETLSNQIAGGPGAAGQASEFLASAEKFAKVTVTSTANAVDLLSSAINAYGFSVGEAERLSAIFFRTIDRGRVRAEDISNSFGQTLQTANALGVSFEEVNAALAVITNQGVKPAVAMTLLNNLFNKMLTPSKELGAVFHKLGVNDGPEAFAAFGGLVGVIQKLDDVTGGAANELAALFHEQRAFRGINSLTQAFGGLKNVITEMQGDTLPKYNAAFAEVMGSSARIVQLQLNNIRNYFLKEFAEPFTDVLAGKTDRGGVAGFFAGLVGKPEDINKAATGLGGLSGAIDKVTSSVQYLAAGFVAYKVAGFGKGQLDNLKTGFGGIVKEYERIRLAQLEVANSGTAVVTSLGSMQKAGIATGLAFRGLGSALKSFFTPEVIFTGVVLGIEYIYKKQQELQAELDNAGKVGEERAKALADASNKYESDKFDYRVRLVKRAVDEEFTVRNKGLADIREIGFRAINDEDALIKKHVENLKGAYTLLVKSVESDIRRVENQASGLTENIRKAEDARNRLNESLEEKKQEQGLKGSGPVDEIKNRAALAEKLRADGQALLQRAAFNNIFTRFVPSIAADPKEISRLMDDGNKKMAKSFDLFKTVGDKAPEIQEKLKHAQEELDKLNKKGGDRDEILKQEQKLKAMEAERADTSHRRRREDQAALDDTIAAQRKKIAAAKEGDRDENDEVKRKELQAQVAQLTQELTLTQQLSRSADSLNAIYEQQSALLKQIAENQEAEHKRTEAKLVSEKDRLQTMRTALGDIAAFKLPKDFEKFNDDAISALTKAGPAKFGLGNIAGLLEQSKVPAVLAKLNADIEKSFATGLLDPQTTFALIKVRAEFEKKANEEVIQHRLSLETDLLAKQKKNLDALQKETTDRRAKAAGSLSTESVSFQGQINNLTTYLSKLLPRSDTSVEVDAGDPVHKQIQALNTTLQYWQARMDELIGGQNYVADLEKQLADARKTPELQEPIARLERSLASAKDTLATQTTESVANKIKETLATIRPLLAEFATSPGQEKSQSYLQGLVPLEGTMGNLVRAAKELEETTKQQKEYEAALKTLSPALQAALEKQVITTDAANEALQTFSIRLDSSIIALNNLQREIDATGLKLKAVIAAPPVQKPINGATFQSPTNGLGPSSSAGSSISIDSITLVNQSTGNVGVDSRQLFDQFTGFLRQGRVQLPNEAFT